MKPPPPRMTQGACRGKGESAKISKLFWIHQPAVVPRHLPMFRGANNAPGGRTPTALVFAICRLALALTGPHGTAPGNKMKGFNGGALEDSVVLMHVLGKEARTPESPAQPPRNCFYGIHRSCLSWDIAWPAGTSPITLTEACNNV